MFGDERGVGNEGPARIASAPPRLRALLAGDIALRDVLAGWIAREEAARRPFLWLAPAMMLGVAFYFASETEPSGWIAVPGLVLGLAAAVALRDRSRSGFAAALALAAVSAGFLSATARTASVAAPVLAEGRAGRIEGIVEELDPRGAGARLLVRPTAIQGLPEAVLPYRIRVGVTKMPDVAAGDRIAATGRLSPPPSAVRPGGYDFSRDAYFKRIGAVGSLAGAVDVLPPVPLPLDLRAVAALDRFRNALTLRIAETIGGQKGAVAAALVTGKRGLIDEETNEALRAAGIYHVVSISGLHMAIAAGLVFWTLRIGFALAGGLALRRPTKKWAAAGAMVAAVVYGVFAGADVATLRAMIMTMVFFGAVLVDRQVISMRNLAVTALILLAFEPEALLSPGFQMSFAAVAALVAVYERVPGAPERRARPGEAEGPPPGLLRRALRAVRVAVVGIVVTTLVAEAATSPFALHHFHTVQAFGLVGNALALPFVSLIVMPAAFIGALATPFGLDGPIWAAMGYGVEAMLAVAKTVAGWPGAVRAVPAFGLPPLLTASAGLLILTLSVSPLRWIGGVAAAGAVVLALGSERPDIFVDRGGTAVAVRGADGRMVVAGRSLGAFTLEQWLRADGDMRDVDDATLRKGVTCDRARCTAATGEGRRVVLVFDPAAFAEACRPDTIVVTPRSATRACADTAAAVVDRQTWERAGAVAFIAGPGGVPWTPKMLTERAPGAARAWTPRRAGG